MKKFLIVFEILLYLFLTAVLVSDFGTAYRYSVPVADKIAMAVVAVVFISLFLLSASTSKNYFLFRTPFISYLILIACFSLNDFDLFISNDLFCISIFSLALMFFASKGDTKLLLSSFLLSALAIFAFVFYNKEITPTNVFFVSFAAIAAIFAFISSRFNNKMEIFRRESVLKMRIANKIQNMGKGGV